MWYYRLEMIIPIRGWKQERGCGYNGRNMSQLLIKYYSGEKRQ